MKKALFTIVAGAAFALVFASVFVVSGCSAVRPAQMSEADLVTAGQVEKMLAAPLFKADFTMAYPRGGRAVPLTSPYYVSVIGDRVESFLPYMGRVYEIPYGGGEGLRFDAPILGYRQSIRKNGQRLVEFTAATDEDTYEFSIVVFPLGECNLTINPLKKQGISFSGQIDLDGEFEAVRVE